MPYLHLELKVVPLGMRQPALARLARLHSLMAAAPGFIEAQVCRYLGDPTRYLVTRTWADAAAHDAYRQSDAQRAFAATPAQGLYHNLLVQEWDEASAAHGTSRGLFVVRSVYQAPPDGWEAFDALRRTRNDAALASGGVQYLRTYRPLTADAPAETLLLRRWTGREAYDRYLECPERAAVPSPFHPYVTECYEVVHEITAT